MIGSIVLLNEMSFAYTTVLYACQYSILGAVIAGSFGFYIGKILETANNSSKKNNSNNAKKSNKKVSNNTEKENINET